MRPNKIAWLIWIRLRRESPWGVTGRAPLQCAPAGHRWTRPEPQGLDLGGAYGRNGHATGQALDEFELLMGPHRCNKGELKSVATTFDTGWNCHLTCSPAPWSRPPNMRRRAPVFHPEPGAPADCRRCRRRYQADRSNVSHVSIFPSRTELPSWCNIRECKLTKPGQIGLVRNRNHACWPLAGWRTSCAQQSWP
jgi:hypothetical protein